MPEKLTRIQMYKDHSGIHYRSDRSGKFMASDFCTPLIIKGTIYGPDESELEKMAYKDSNACLIGRGNCVDISININMEPDEGKKIMLYPVSYCTIPQEARSLTPDENARKNGFKSAHGTI
jgi:hypothetical protein